MASITREQAQIVAKLPRDEGRLRLASSLGWEPFDEEDDFQTALKLDYLYDSFMFTVGKGFPWDAICVFVKLADDMLQESIGKSLVVSVKLFSKKINALTATCDERVLKTYTGFYFDTFFHQYKLYQYVFSNERQKLQISKTLPVDVPRNPCDLKSGKELAVWEYQKKVDAVEEREEEAKQKREDALAIMCEWHEAILEVDKEKVETTQVPLERQELLEIMRSVAADHVEATSQSIRHSIRCSMEELSFMLEKTVIPRPAVLGAPPRFKLKVAEGSANKRDKANVSRASRNSGRKSKASAKK